MSRRLMPPWAPTSMPGIARRVVGRLVRGANRQYHETIPTLRVPRQIALAAPRQACIYRMVNDNGYQ